MLRRKLPRRLTVWLTLVAMLFSALSPALASVLFAHRPDVMARALALPGPGSLGITGIVCHSPDIRGAAPSSTAPLSEESSDQTAHGIFCGFCLNASAGFALLTLPDASALTLAVRAENSLAQQAPLPARPLASNHRSRAPPTLS